MEQRIDEEEYIHLTKTWRHQQNQIEAHLLKNKYLISNYLSKSLGLLAKAQGAYGLFMNSDHEGRAALIKSLLRVSEFKDGRIIPNFKPPLDILYQIITNAGNKN
jgi:hypothetical protein